MDNVTIGMLPTPGHLDDVIMIVIDAARAIEKVAKRRRSWPETGKIKVWEAGVDRERLIADYREGKKRIEDVARPLRLKTVSDIREMEKEGFI